MTSKTEIKKDPGEFRRHIRIADVRTPIDSGKTTEQLQAEIEQAGPAPLEPTKRTVARDAIHVAEAVFQWRGGPDKDQWDRQNHIHTLAKALREQGQPLAPLLVMPVGQRFYVIDGHHRLAAYDTAEWTKDIPVAVFTGNLTAARLRGLASNVKDKLPMTARAKSEAAWQIVKENLGGLTAQEVANRTSVSLRQVKYMRAAWKGLNEREGAVRGDLMKLTWNRASDLWKNGEETTSVDFERDGWKEQKAREVVELIRRTNVAAALMQDMEVTALALMRLSEDLPVALMEWWTGDYSEAIEELAARIANPEADDHPF